MGFLYLGSWHFRGFSDMRSVIIVLIGAPSKGDPSNSVDPNRSQLAPTAPQRALVVPNGGLRVSGLVNRGLLATL